ncbi:MAG: hypothetical protein RLZZ581_731, partial [Actinomycetota bacterium]
MIRPRFLSPLLAIVLTATLLSPAQAAKVSSTFNLVQTPAFPEY